MVTENLKYTKATIESINFLCTKAHENDIVKAVLIRKAKEWAGVWLLAFDEKVQETTFLLLSQLILASDLKASQGVFHSLLKMLPSIFSTVRTERQKHRGFFPSLLPPPSLPPPFS
jgi:hypothetical protein